MFKIKNKRRIPKKHFEKFISAEARKRKLLFTADRKKSKQSQRRLRKPIDTHKLLLPALVSSASIIIAVTLSLVIGASRIKTISLEVARKSLIHAIEGNSIVVVENSLVDSLVSQQSNTLAVSAAVMGVVSLFFGWLYSRQDKRVEEAKNEYEETEKELEETLEVVKNLNRIQGMDAAFVSYELQELRRSFQQSSTLKIKHTTQLFALLNLYSRLAASQQDDDVAIALRREATQLENHIDWDSLSKPEQDMIHYKLGHAYLNWAQLELGRIGNEDDVIKKIQAAMRYFSMLYCDVVPVQYLNNAIGLSNLWLSKMYEQKGNEEAAVKFIFEACERYQAVVKGPVKHHQFHNSYAAALIRMYQNLNVCKRLPRCGFSNADALLKESKKEIEKALQLKSDYPNALANGCDMNLLKIYSILGLSKQSVPTESFRHATIGNAFQFDASEDHIVSVVPDISSILKIQQEHIKQIIQNTELYVREAKKANVFFSNSYRFELQINIIDAALCLSTNNRSEYKKKAASLRANYDYAKEIFPKDRAIQGGLGKLCVQVAEYLEKEIRKEV